MALNFTNLNIDGSIISELKAVPSKKIVLTLIRGPQKKNERSVQSELDLQFNQVEWFNVAFQAEPWLQILSHSVSSESDYLSRWLAHSTRMSEIGEMFHFEIVTNQGRIDVIANSFVFSLFNEIRYVE